MATGQRRGLPAALPALLLLAALGGVWAAPSLYDEDFTSEPRPLALAVLCSTWVAWQNAAAVRWQPPAPHARRAASLTLARPPSVRLAPAAVPDIHGTPRRLSREFRGKVLLIVNVASKCGFTGALLWGGGGAWPEPPAVGRGGLAVGAQRRTY